MDVSPDSDPHLRRAAYAAEVAAEIGIDEPMIARLVHAFYGKLRSDALLGPVFAARVSDWDTHLPRMCAFWSSVALMSGRYHGTPMRAHLSLPIGPEHFARWLAVWRETAEAECPPAAASRFIALAGRIAESLAMGIAVRNDAVPAART
ncbi:MAG TPA: group III truncated hemoglobin [Acetobacteraceae bacterium]|nr:group III truncated hemoglobin [Acetobacteraceae bacterium]